MEERILKIDLGERKIWVSAHDIEDAQIFACEAIKDGDELYQAPLENFYGVATRETLVEAFKGLEMSRSWAVDAAFNWEFEVDEEVAVFGIEFE